MILIEIGQSIVNEHLTLPVLVTNFLCGHRAGTIAWQELRDIAHACWLFEGGRKLYETYVNIVVATRLPELFDMKRVGFDDKEDQEVQGIKMHQSL